MIEKGNIVRGGHQVEIEIKISVGHTQQDDIRVERHAITLQYLIMVRGTQRNRDGGLVSEAAG
jgi:hypothetical protein